MMVLLFAQSVNRGNPFLSLEKEMTEKEVISIIANSVNKKCTIKIELKIF